MSSPSKIDAVLCCRISISLKQQVLDFRSKYKLRSETQAITQLLQLALFLDAKRESIDDPSVVQYLREHLHDQQIVDWAFSLPEDRLMALLSLFNDARHLKNRARMGRK